MAGKASSVPRHQQLNSAARRAGGGVEMADLYGKVAIVTGSTKGIGRAIAEALIAANARVTISARTSADVERVAAELNKSSRSGERRVLGVTTDVRKYEDCRELVQQTADTFGRVDILINNAGV